MNMSAVPEDVFALHEERHPDARAALSGRVNGVVVFLDVDDTILKEVDLLHREKETVQMITYKPSEYVLSKYKARLEEAPDPSKVVHYEVHEDGETVSSAVAVRPGMDTVFSTIAKFKDVVRDCILVSANDDGRTAAVCEQVTVGGKKLNEWGFRTCSREVSIQNRKKELPSIKEWASLPHGEGTVCMTVFLDDKPEDILNGEMSDVIIPCEAFGKDCVATYIETGSMGLDCQTDKFLVPAIESVLCFAQENVSK